MQPVAPEASRILGRYALYGEIASGGMATVHLGRLVGPVGFSRTVAIKRLHAQYAKEPTFVSMFLDEARLAARIRHPNVVGTLDVVADVGELFLVMEYVEGESLARLLRSARAKPQLVPLPIVGAIMSGMLHGLHAAHEATDERGEALGIVHRDISPDNVLVGRDGVPRIIDFGVAKAANRVHSTRNGDLKGKLAYMAPEQIRGNVSRRTDIYAASVVLWESLVGKKLFRGENDAEILAKVLEGDIMMPSRLVASLPPEIDEIVACGLNADPAQRFATAREMARAIELCLRPTAAVDVGEWVDRMAQATLLQRARLVAGSEQAHASMSSGDQPVTELYTPAHAPLTPAPATLATIAAATGHAGDRPTPSSSATRPALSSSVTAPAKTALPPVVYLLIGASAMAAFGVGALALTRQPPTATPPEPGIASSSAPRADGTASDSRLPPPAASIVAPTPKETASASVEPPLAATASAALVKPQPSVRSTPAAPRCNPPYTVDAMGDKHYKRECLK